MNYKITRIPPSGRNKYGNYMSSTNVGKIVIAYDNYGNTTTTGDTETDKNTEEIQTLEIIECYEKNIINKRLKDFEEAKADIENKVENK